MGGAREVVVAEADAEAARAILAAAEQGDFEGEDPSPT
jgi:hypothetical protein